MKRSSGILARNASTSLARREILSPRRDGPGPGRPKGIVQIAGEDEESETLAVVLVPDVDPVSPVEHGPLVAIIEWGNGSGTAIAEVDFAKGTVIQVAGSFLSVAGRNDGNLPDGTRGPDGETTPLDPDPDDQEVAVIVSGYGDRPAAGRATRTFYRRGFPPGGSWTVVVPNFARSFFLTRAPIATTAVAISIADGPDFAAKVREGPYFLSGAPVSRLDLYGQAGAVTVSNAGTTAIDALQLVFELGL